MLHPDQNALVLAPMDGVTDASMRTLQGASGAFTYAVTEFLRVSQEALPAKVFRREVPELANGCRTPAGMPVQVQILGGDPLLMARSAATACACGAMGIDVNFGCPAPTVNRHDGGASLLQHPTRLRDIVAAVRDAVPPHMPVSAKLRLGWDHIDAIHENAAMVEQAGASWITIHARTRTQGYQPPVYWKPIGLVRQSLGIPVVANGDIWSLDDFKKCQEQTGCRHFMIGRGALANPLLPYQIASELGIGRTRPGIPTDWIGLLRAYVECILTTPLNCTPRPLLRLKQWAKIAHQFGDFPRFEVLKTVESVDEFFDRLLPVAC